MPLGISPSVRPTRLRSTSLPTCSDRNILLALYSYNTLACGKFFFIVAPHDKENMTSDTVSRHKSLIFG